MEVLLQLTIEKLVYGGDGLARLPADENGRGKAVFLPFVLEAEIVEASLLEQKRGFARARTDKIVQASPLRTAPKCPYFGECGGCHYQHTGYAHQLEIKVAILKENLRRIAKIELDTDLIVHPSPEWNYRNHTRIQIRTEPEFALGYYKFNSHQMLPVEQCPISSPLINRALAAIWQLGRAGKMTLGVQEIEFFVNAEDSALLLQLHASNIRRQAAKQIVEDMKSVLPETAGISVLRRRAGHGSESEQIVSLGAGEFVYNTQRASYRVSHGAFFQVNRHLVDELVKTVTDGHSGDIALDLYAGVGLFSKVLSQSFAQVIAVESSPTSHLDLAHNSPSGVRTVPKTTEQFLEGVADKLRPNFVVVDPPRSGLGETVVRGLAGLGAGSMVYVSCDPATLSRDLAGLLSAGYRIQQAHVVDLFPQTYHVESVFHLVR
ncbi:MAG TPA: 23S rRNA (uracil(1939)-C(5))-methyltransferase RlmD [Terriglobales bacterium]|nr:23S rRNA (uracil(1939)-C(5))-methyltransferase RlmD [Terriglobales bacterium]